MATPLTGPLEENQLLERLTEKYHTLGKQTRAVAEYVLRNPRSIVSLSIAELADECGVSQFTVTHLCKSIGLSGYQELKLALSKLLVQPLENIHEEIQEADEIQDVAAKLASSHTSSIDMTQQHLDVMQVKRVVEALSNASRVEFYGMGTAGVAAQSALNKFFRLGIDVRAPQDSHFQAMSAALLKPGDVAIGISTSGSSKEVLEAIRQAKLAGAETVAVTSNMGSPLAKMCNLRIITHTPELLYRSESMENLIAQIYILDILFVCLALQKTELFLGNLERTRKSLLGKKV